MQSPSALESLKVRTVKVCWEQATDVHLQNYVVARPLSPGGPLRAPIALRLSLGAANRLFSGERGEL